MKLLLIISAFFLSLNAFSQDANSTQIDNDKYISMAEDMCGCFNQALTGLSEEAKEVIEQAAANGTDLEEALMQYAENYPTQAVEDFELFENFGDEDFESCIDQLEVKYDMLEAEDDDGEIERKLIEAMSNTEGCKITHAFVLAGMGI